MKFNYKKRSVLLASIIGVFILFLSICASYSITTAKENASNLVFTAQNENVEGKSDQTHHPKEHQEDFIYLSDLNYITANRWSYTGWGNILKDTTSSGGKITVRIEGAYYTFEKGMWAHAPSALVYDISNYKYKYFTTYAGLNSSAAASSNGVKFFVYTSMDGRDWDLKTAENPSVVNTRTNAEYIKIELNGAKYLKLVADSNGGNGNDHSVYADAKLTNGEAEENVIPSTSYYDEIIKTKYQNVSLDNEEYELVVLQREFVNRVGQYALQRYVKESSENEETLNWLFHNVDNLKEFLMGGTPDGGSYYNSLNVLSRLYKNYKTDLDNNTKLNNTWDSELTYGELYRKMMFAISLTHSQRVGLWMQSGNTVNQSDPVRRYAIFKYLHKNQKFIVTKNADGTPNIDITPWFEALKVEEMRFIFNNAIDDEEILWLNAYTQSRIDAAPGSAWGLLTPHPYMAYVWPNYGNNLYYDAANVEYFNDLFAVPIEGNSTEKVGLFDVTYTIPGGVDEPTYTLKITRGTPDNKIYKVWMNFRNKFGTGAVCGGISKSGSNIRTVHGIPATVIGQPGHAALLYYTKNSEGKGYWRIDNDVSGWTYSEKGERMLLGWGNASYQRGYSVVYMELAETAINDYENLVKAEERVMLAKSYQGDLRKQEELYREALRIQPINIDAWYGLIETFNASETKSEEEYYNLAEDIANNLVEFPLPMYHLTNLIKPKFTTAEYIFQFTLLQTKTLTKSSKIQNSEAKFALQPGITRGEANHLLGNLDKNIATFSFDGEDAGKIILASKFDGSGVRFEYSLDGKNSWIEKSFTGEEEHKLKLTNEEISSITAENDIYIHIVGVPRSDENLYKIDITEQTISSTVYANDLENRMMGIDLTYEWKNNPEDHWTSYRVASPNNNGDKTLYIRVGATGTKLASETQKYTFTKNNESEVAKYISINHLTINEFSTESVDTKRPFYAPNAIDGNPNTLWHTDFRYNVTQQETKPFIIIELDEPKYLSALEFLQTKYKKDDPDSIKNMIVSVSEDKENWTVVGRKDDCPIQPELHRIDFKEKIFGKYVKLEMDAHNIFVSLAMVNLFEDTTKNPPGSGPTANIGYSITEPTNKNVEARLVNPSTPITITNPDGLDRHIFTENGEYTFTFVDENGLEGSATARVDWIDRIAPTASIEYSTTEKTRGTVIATLKPSENVTVINNGNYRIDSDGIIWDKNGNKHPEYKVDQDGNILDKEGNRITNINPFRYEFTNNGEFTFEFVDVAGNKGTATAKVDWIVTDELKPTLTYSTNDPTNQEVTVTLKVDREVTILNNEGSNTYTFTENGEFTFEFVDETGYKGTATAKVDWIDKKAPTPTLTYDITNLTNQGVTVTISFDEEAIILNNNGSKTYTFKENGTFTFEFKDIAGNQGTITASVDWIDTKAPIANLIYSTNDPTNQEVTVTIEFDRDATILNNDGNNTYTFKENGTFIFEFTDAEGNQGTALAKVDWIDRTAPTPTLSYNITSATNQDVTVTIEFDEETILLNNEGKRTYTFKENGTFIFEFQDLAGNIGTITAYVDWIQKTIPTAELEYDKTNKQIATVKVVNASTELTFEEGNGIYEFTENGTYIIRFYDKAGNMGSLIAIIDWLEKQVEIEVPDRTETNNQDHYNDSETKKEFIYDTVKITGSAKDFENVEGVNVKKLKLTTKFEKQVEKESEMMEFNFITQDHKMMKSIGSSFTLTIDLNPNKDFITIYLVTENGLEELNYTRQNNQIVIKTSTLGKYIIEYKERPNDGQSVVDDSQSVTDEKESEKNDSQSIVDSNNKNNNSIWILVGGTVTAVLLGAIFMFYKKKI